MGERYSLYIEYALKLSMYAGSRTMMGILVKRGHNYPISAQVSYTNRAVIAPVGNAKHEAIMLQNTLTINKARISLKKGKFNKRKCNGDISSYTTQSLTSCVPPEGNISLHVY